MLSLVSQFRTRSSHLFVIVVTVATVLSLSGGPAQAAQVTDRSVTISTAVTSATASDLFQFTYASTDPVGSVAFEYCYNSPLPAVPCVAPAGLDVSGATLASQSGNTGFGIDSADSTSNKIVLTRAAVAALAIPSSYDFSGIINPSTGNQTTFVRLYTYGSTDGSGAYIDHGGVAFATISPFNVGATVPPFIRLCVGITVAPDCSSVSGDNLNLGTLLPSKVSAGTSQFAGGTNSASGYSVFAFGTTMTSGNYIINENNAPVASSPGSAQFGINLRTNSDPAIGADATGAGTAAPTADYNQPNRFKFISGDMIANDNLPSDYNTMTVTYVVNVPPGQTPGVYSTTLTYMATAQF